MTTDNDIISTALRRLAILSDESQAVRERAYVLADLFEAQEVVNEDEGLEPVEEWGTAQYGLIHVAPPENEGVTRERAERLADDPHSLSTPIRRRVLVIDGVTYSTPWVRVPTAAQRVDHPDWPEEVELR